jgi:hypothetical protein
MLINKSIEQHCLSFEDVLGLWVETFFKKEIQALEHLGPKRLMLMVITLSCDTDLDNWNALICDELKSSLS